MSNISRRTFTLAPLAEIPLRGLAADTPFALPFRQVHLDFHTSEEIPNVGADFDGREFAGILKAARVNSINVFAKCHHGWAYYDTQIAHRHPNLKPGLDMLGEMVTHCRAAGIDVLYYYSLVWDVRVARANPEWRMLNRDGSVIGGIPGDAWPWICMNTPYLDLVARENEELIGKYAVKGAWFDILKQPPGGCWCKWCVEDRKRLGLTDSKSEIAKHNKHVAVNVEKRLNDIIHKHKPDALTFYNSRLVVGVRDELDAYSHIEIESLPTGGWGYSHFQQRVRYMRTLGKEMVGMTGRFHKSWGDFGGLKNQAALDYECMNFLANGAKCCVGDQLHPNGRLDAATYKRIGRTYFNVESIEPWVRSANAVTEVAVVSTALFNTESTQKITESDQGFTNMLVELHHQFNVVDLEEDLSKYKVVILPDEIRPSLALLKKLDAFVTAGGGVLITGESLLNPRTMWWDWCGLDGVRYQGKAKFEGEYLRPSGTHLPSLERYDYFLYQNGQSIAVDHGWDVLATYTHPFFDRSAERFSSHKQTPPGPATFEPAVVRKGRVIYLANPVFRSYALDGVPALKQMIGDLLATLLPEPLVEAPGLPSTAQLTVLEQPSKKRTLVWLLNYPMTRRAPNIDIIEEPGVLVDQTVRLRMPKSPSRAVLVPQGVPLTVTYENGMAGVNVGRIRGHQAIAFENS